jgi:hypothetical protein
MSARARRAAPVVAVLALLAAVSGVTWAVWGDGSRFEKTMQAADPTPRLPYLVDTNVLVRLSGHVVFDRDGPVERFARGNVLTPAEMEIVEEGGVTDAEATITLEDGVTLGLWRFSVRDGASPWGLFGALDGLYAAGRHELVKTAHPDVLLRRSGNTFHAHYVHGQDVLRIEGYGENGDAVTAHVLSLLDRQVERSPADEQPV